MTDILPDCFIDVARDLTWTCALARYSDGLVVFYVQYDEQTSELQYGLMMREE